MDYQTKDELGDDLYNRIDALEKSNQALERETLELRTKKDELNIQLMRTMAKLSDAEDTVKRWRTELEIVTSKSGHNLCHIWIPELLKRTLGYVGNFPDPEKMTKEEFKIGCRFYQDDIFGPDKMPPYSSKMFGRKAIFLDRDGTVIEAIHRPHRAWNIAKEFSAPFILEELRFYPDAQDALDALRIAGFLTVMITNQPDVRHGYMTEENWQKIHKTVMSYLDFDDYFMCRHTSEDNCPFKKPSPLMLQAAADKWGIDLSRSYMIGDTDKDMDAGRAAGCKTILLDRHYNQGIDADFRRPTLSEAFKVIVG